MFLNNTQSFHVVKFFECLLLHENQVAKDVSQ